MQLLSVITRIRLRSSICFGPGTYICAFACALFVCKCCMFACAHRNIPSVWTGCTWKRSFPTCVWLKPITADDSCGAAGRQWDMSVHLCSSSCRADQPQSVTQWQRMILNHWLNIHYHIQGDGYHSMYVNCGLGFRFAYSLWQRTKKNDAKSQGS